MLTTPPPNPVRRLALGVVAALLLWSAGVDAEGNGYSPLSDYWTGAYRAETTWRGEVGFERETELPKGYSEEDYCDGEPALILCPVN